ncbi:MAG: hypothetical protein ACYSUI_06125 [Planctomycetota bacterium]|jgi:hypothetical protein
MQTGTFDQTPAARRAQAAACLAAALFLSAGCGTAPTAGASSSRDVLASVINVTPFESSVVLSGVADDAVDTVERTIGPSDSTDVRFVCLDELVVGDPLEPAVAGIVIDADGEAAEIAPFSILVDESFVCGDVIEIIISGADAETLAVDVFSFTPP